MSQTNRPPKRYLLSGLEYEILRQVAYRIVPWAIDMPGLDLAERIDAVLAQVRPQMGRDFKILLLVFEYGAPFLGGGIKRFTRMSQDAQDRYLTNWEHSRLGFKRMGFQVLRRAALAAFYGSPESWARIGYPGPWLTRGYPHDFKGTTTQHPAHR